MEPGLSKEAGAGFHSHLAPAPSALSKEVFSLAFNIVSLDSEVLLRLSWRFFCWSYLESRYASISPRI